MNTDSKTIFNNSIYVKVTKYLFPAVLVIYAFLGVNRGIDITDVGYNLGNYRYLSELDGMWFYSTFLANIIGAVFTHLPFPHAWNGNIQLYPESPVLALGVQILCKRSKSVTGERFSGNVHIPLALLGSADMYISLFELLYALCYRCTYI